MKIISMRVQADDGTMGSVIKYHNVNFVTIQWDEPRGWQDEGTDRLTDEYLNDLLYETNLAMNLAEIEKSNV
jgi:hypothetical protein